MNRLYTLTIILLSTLFLSRPVTAQIYTAVRSGNWDVPSGTNVWDLSGEPPSNCNNCTITIQSGNTITLNTHVNLTGNSQLIIGTNTALGATQLVVSPASGASGFSTGFNVILDNTGGSGTSKIVLFDNISSIHVPTSSPTTLSTYDGFLSTNDGYLKVVGNAPAVFKADGSVQFSSDAVKGNTLTGPETLNAPGSLPVVLMVFEATLDGKVTDLHWTTSLESNSDHFAIERSTDAGSHWEVLGTVPAQGNSALPVAYSYTDADPAAGANEYRLRMVDRDGKYGYSEVRVVRTGMAATVSVYPNPARDYVNITLGEGVSASTNIRLISQSGQLLVEKKVTGGAGTIVSLPVSGYPQGNYLVLVTGADGAQQVSKLMITK
jgi:hypothetical protein